MDAIRRANVRRRPSPYEQTAEPEPPWPGGPYPFPTWEAHGPIVVKADPVFDTRAIEREAALETMRALGEEPETTPELPRKWPYVVGLCVVFGFVAMVVLMHALP